MDTVGAFGVKRLKPAYRDRIPKVVEYLYQVYRDQIPFDYDLAPDDRDLYCVEMAEKAFRHAGLTLSQPVVLADMENIDQFPLCILGFTSFTKLRLDLPVFFPGNDRHGIWASPLLETIYESPSDGVGQGSEPIESDLSRREPACSAEAEGDHGDGSGSIRPAVGGTEPIRCGGRATGDPARLIRGGLGWTGKSGAGTHCNPRIGSGRMGRRSLPLKNPRTEKARTP